MSFSIVGEILGIVGLVLTALALVRTWNAADGKRYDFWTDDLKERLHVQKFGNSEIGYATTTLYAPTDDLDERIRRVEESINEIRTSISEKEGKRDKREELLGDRVDELVKDAVVNPNQHAREETRWAAIGLAVVAFGSLLQLFGTIFP